MSSRIASLSLKQRLTLVDLERIIQDIRVGLDEEISRQPSGFLASMMLPPSKVKKN